MLELIRSVETTIVLVVSVLISNFVRSILILTRQYSFRLLICEAFRTVVLNIVLMSVIDTESTQNSVTIPTSLRSTLVYWPPARHNHHNIIQTIQLHAQ